MILLTNVLEMNNIMMIQLPENYIGSPVVFFLKALLFVSILVTGFLYIFRYGAMRFYVRDKEYLLHGLSAICYAIFIFCCGILHQYMSNYHDLAIRIGLVFMLFTEVLLIAVLKRAYRHIIYFRKYVSYVLDIFLMELLLVLLCILFGKYTNMYALAVLLNELVICCGILYLYHKLKVDMWQRKASVLILSVGIGIDTAGVLLNMEATCIFTSYSLLAMSICIALYLALNKIILNKTEAACIDLYIKQNIAYKKQQMEIARTQLNEHFVFNTINMITAQIGSEPERAKRTIGDFAQYLRYNLEAMGSEKMIPFSKEIMQIHNYLKIEQERFPDKINVVWDLQCVRFKIPSLAVQTLIENAVRFGVSKKIDGGTIWIKTWSDAEDIIVEIRDNGIGADSETLAKRESLYYLSKQFDGLDGYELSISGEVNVGCVARIHIKGMRHSYENHSCR